MSIYDISLTLSARLPVWPGDPPVVLEQVEAMDKGAEYNMTRLAMSVHAGTHVDAPHHFLNDGRTVEALSLEVLTGLCYVVQLPHDVDEITAEVLRRTPLPEGMERILFGTRNSRWWAQGVEEFQTDFVAISEDGAQWLVERGVKLVGVDYLSVAPYHASVPTHRILLQAGVIALEGVNLSQVPRGFYDLYCLPLKLAGSDGAPARAILVRRP
ncbi:MAG: cyclase [Anaerolineae bacterium]|nr:MAG: cyclase [Anaerolineae bacterium]